MEHAMNTSNHNLSDCKKRAKLAARKEPYWQKIDRGISLGYRRKEASGTWIVRHWTTSGKKVEKAVGDCGIGYQCALSLALKEAKTPSQNTEMRLEEVFSSYMTYVSEHCAPSTIRDTEYRIKAHLLSPLGRVQLNKLSTKQLIEWRSALLRDKESPEALRRAKDTANRVTSILKAALNRAFQQGWCDSDSAWRRLKPYPMAGAAREGFLTEQQASKLIANCEGRFRALAIAALLTGCRFGELQKLEKDDFDPQNRSISIRNGKTGSRFVYLSPDAVELFSSLCREQADGPVFLNDHNRPWTKEQQRRALRKALRAADLPAITFYELRHSHASIALSRGINHQILAENMGTSIRMLEKHYGKFMVEVRRSQMSLHAPQLGEIEQVDTSK